MKRIILVAICFLLVACNGVKNITKSLEKDERVDIVYYDYFDTVIEFSYYGKASMKEEVEKKLEEKIKYYHNLLTDFDENGIVAKINRDGEGVSAELASLTKLVLEDEKKTDYTLDLSKGELYRLWKKTIETGILPEENEIKQAMQKGGKGSVKVDGDRIILSDGAKLDFGSVSKGFLNDELEKTIAKLGIENYILNSGGNVSVKGSPGKDRDSFNIGISNPYTNGEGAVDSLKVTNTSIVTSGDYQRYTMIDGIRFHHIIDNQTGYPAKNGKRSLTVIGPKSYTCDFLSTTLFLKSAEEIEEILKSYPGYYTIIYFDDETFYASPEIMDKLTSQENK